MEPFRPARGATLLDLFGMNRKQADSERERVAAEHPEATWLVAEQAPGEWSVVKVGLTPPDGPEGSATEARAKPDYADDPRAAQVQNAPYGNG